MIVCWLLLSCLVVVRLFICGFVARGCFGLWLFARLPGFWVLVYCCLIVVRFWLLSRPFSWLF